MYSVLKNVQVLVSLLKKYEVENIVISAGTRHTPLVVSVENDSFFKTYSVVDERSASFFAIGLIEKLRKPVAIVCTSGTASANYVSAANEAFYQQLPLLLLTADRNPYYMFQQEEQMIPQENLYKSVCKKTVTLGHVRDEKDFWYVSRLCNEALLDLTQGEPGPVHINFVVENDYPIQQGIVNFSEENLPDIKRISRLTLEDEESVWKQWQEKLKNSRILIVYGQNGILDDYEKNEIEKFCKNYNCVISKDLISNLHVSKAIPTFSICRKVANEIIESLCPDILITMHANTISEIKNRYTMFRSKFEHWHVSANGQVSDPFKILSDVIACSPKLFFRKFNDLAVDTQLMDDSYYEQWNAVYQSVGNKGSLNNVKIDYSALFAMQKFISRMPKDSLLHIGNSNSIRLANYFDLDESVEVYDNRGAHGIDGSMSAFVGQAYIEENEAFLVIGDLSFFYDMNALWNHYIRNNMHIMVINNSGGAIFHTYPNKYNVPSLDSHIAAEHHNSVKAWAIDRGFEYVCANDSHSFEKYSEQFFKQNRSKPILFEVFTDKDVDAKAINSILAPKTAKTVVKSIISKTVPNEVKSVLKKVMK